LTNILWIIGSTVLFSFQYLFKKLFQRQEGSSFVISMQSSLISAIFAILLLILRGKSAFEFSLFSFALALLHGGRAILTGFVSFKVLEKANISVFSLFSQIGGMLLPFLYAIILGGEQLTWQKTVCVVLLCLAMYWEMHGRQKSSAVKGEKKDYAIFWYMGVFVLNGLSGVFAKIHQSAPDHLTVSASAFTMMEKIVVLIASSILVLIFARRKQLVKMKKPVLAISYMGIQSILNTLGNLILLMALLHVDASIQYPIVTGGIIILSLFMDPLLGTKPKRYTVEAALISFVGLVFLAI